MGTKHGASILNFVSELPMVIYNPDETHLPSEKKGLKLKDDGELVSYEYGKVLSLNSAIAISPGRIEVQEYNKSINDRDFEFELFEFLSTFIPFDDIHMYKRGIVNPYEIPILVKNTNNPYEKCNFAFEFIDLFWCRNEIQDKLYHQLKTTALHKSNIKLIHIFTDDWLTKKEDVQRRIKEIISPQTITSLKIQGISKYHSDIQVNKMCEIPANSDQQYSLLVNDQISSIFTYTITNNCNNIRVHSFAPNRDLHFINSFLTTELRINNIRFIMDLRYGIVINSLLDSNVSFTAPNLYKVHHTPINWTKSYIEYEPVQVNDGFLGRKDVDQKFINNSSYCNDKVETMYNRPVKESAMNVSDCGYVIYKLKL